MFGLKNDNLKCIFYANFQYFFLSSEEKSTINYETFNSICIQRPNVNKPSLVCFKRLEAS